MPRAEMLRLTPITQSFARPRVADLGDACGRAVDALRDSAQPGMKIAVTAGSRGIANIAFILRAVVDALKARGAQPFIVPAMGSHGGATAEGQSALLSDYGITEDSMGVPIRATMETVELPGSGSTCDVFMDRLAWESDGVVLVNRIKPHTSFHGDYESGLVKMAVIGLGKHRQALAVHADGATGLRTGLPAAARCIFATGKVLGGVAIVENAYDETMRVEGIRGADILAEEPALLMLARENMPSLPVDHLDLLVVDRLGKNISGVGMDPNIIGRVRVLGEPEPTRPQIKSIAVMDVTKESHGNALGIGLADVITRRLLDSVDFNAMYANVRTSTFLERAKVPVTAESDKDAVELALRSCGNSIEGRERVIRIRDTLSLGNLLVSDPVLEELGGRRGIRISGPSAPLLEGNALTPWSG